MEKSVDAFRTISEVAEDLALPQHVLRFWETKFPQIRPLKRAGGRRYYRPADLMLLRSIRQLLYDEGYTIRGVQRLLKEQGTRSLRAGEPLGLVLLDERVEILGSGESSPVEVGVDRSDVEAEPPRHLSVPPDTTALREALTCLEDCERILTAVRRSRG